MLNQKFGGKYDFINCAITKSRRTMLALMGDNIAKEGEKH